ncbi:flagellar basal-body MS-ring/collar protein FliF [Actinosynnema mirum]|uniref:Flagellar M-ring protein n=1 Tax=Actinosynnema mirum (strain ATCC 29888 / DSM 43827 / JCM 3225 / NBRC 14064 / NCIMB 13271 / NRRL B-12336 / IMRU 3971 / 101) TaxID=446462 RepID=C6WJR2_ACTMD|nr:flagellar basal-body MS-ring/collar protein FliF [Actinosynnema mirum]ACU36287.1 flagellar M-ring protein FliF [Actinosynnema mirum DSM 43827]
MNLDRIKASAQGVLSGFKAFTAGQKLVAGATVLAVVGAIAFYFLWASKPTYAPLYTSLASKDASAIVDQLTAAGVTYELTDGGQTIMVPQDQVYPMRLKMSAANLPSQSDTGYALLDQQGVTTSEFMQQVGYQRAMEGELGSTIKAIDGVTSASVHLAIPQKDVFSDSDSKPTAAVLVGTGAGKSLSQAQVQTITHLVSSSVEGMSADGVTVAGTDGKVLSTGGADGASASANGDRDDQTKAFEQRLSTSLQQMLSQVVGQDHAVVQVTADLDYDQTETKSQTYTSGDGTAPLSESSTTESYTGDGGQNAAGGVLGSTNGTLNGLEGNTTNGTGGSGNGTYNQEKSTRNNAVNSVIETRQSAPGKVRKLGVAVLLDQKTAGAVDMAEVERIASSAVALDTARGDTLAVSSMPFDTSAAQQGEAAVAAQQAQAQQDELMGMVKTGVAGLGVLALLIMTMIATRRRRKRAAAAAEAELAKLDELKAQLERTRTSEIEAAIAEKQALVAGNDFPQLSGPKRAEVDPLVVAEQEKRMGEIQSLVDEQPEEVARLLRGWLAVKG